MNKDPAIQKYLYGLKKNPHPSLLTNVIIKAQDYTKPYLALPLTCILTSQLVWIPLRNKECKNIRCIFGLSEEFAKWALKTDFLICPSCSSTLSKDNFAICAQTDSILAVAYSQKPIDIKDTVYLDIPELVKDNYRSPDKFVIFDEKFFMMTPINGRSRTTSRDSDFFHDQISILQETLAAKAEKIEQNFQEKKSTSAQKMDQMSPNSNSKERDSSPTKTNKWKARMNEASPENKLNKWQNRERSSSPEKRINKWENRKLKDLNLTKLIPGSATCRANYLNILARDTFNNYCKTKTIHYFQEKTKFLHLLDLIELFEITETNQLRLTRVELNITYKIPDSHCSLVDGYGEIYLIGGYDSAKSYRETKDILVFDELNKTLVPKGTMLVGRSGHACCLIRENIYIVGGYCDDKTLKTCERFNCLTGKTEQIADMNTETAFSCIVPYNNKYIFKFGGRISLGKMDEGIERYDVTFNKWEPLYLSPTLKKIYKGMCLSAGIQANPSGIFVFGGCYDYFGEKSSTSYIFSLQNDDETPAKITGIEKISIPIAERFDCNNQVIVHENHLFCLQNLQKSKKDIKQGEFAKRILICDGSSWILVN